jgi:hypothetical protein
MITLFQTLEKTVPEITPVIVEYNKTGKFNGFPDAYLEIIYFNGLKIGSNFDCSFHFFESDKELGIKIYEHGILIIDVGVSVENIKTDDDIFNAIKEEIELLIGKLQQMHNDF